MENTDQEETRKYNIIKRLPGEIPMLMKYAELDYFVKGYVYEKEMKEMSARKLNEFKKEYGQLSNAQALGIELKDGDLAQELSQSSKQKRPKEPLVAPPHQLLASRTRSSSSMPSSMPTINYYTQKKKE